MLDQLKPGSDQILSSYISISMGTSYVPLLLNCLPLPFGGLSSETQPTESILWYGPGTLQDYIWDLDYNYADETITVKEQKLSINGRFRPIVGYFGGTYDGCEDILWYAPGTDPDYLWFFNPALALGIHGAPQFKNRLEQRQLSINGSYQPFVCDLWDASDHYPTIIWYAPGSGTESAWQWLSGSDTGRHRSVAFPSVAGSYRPSCAFSNHTISWWPTTGTRGAYWADFKLGAKPVSKSFTLPVANLRPSTQHADRFELAWGPGAIADFTMNPQPPSPTDSSQAREVIIGATSRVVQGSNLRVELSDNALDRVVIDRPDQLD